MTLKALGMSAAELDRGARAAAELLGLQHVGDLLLDIASVAGRGAAYADADLQGAS